MKETGGHAACDAVAASLTGAGVEGPSPARASALGLEDQAKLIGAYRWTEHQLFELLGAWVRREPSDEARLLFDLHSQQHAWHAQLFAERLPVLDGVDRDALCVAPSADVERVMELVGATEGTLLRLVGAGRLVLPRLVGSYTLHLQRAAAVADAPLVRALRLVLRDELEAWQATEVMVQSLLRGTDGVGAAAGHLRSLEAVLAGMGPGLVSWPTRALRDIGA